ncbi:MAG: heme ABC exporter ATP-binding protein CcmA [Chloroflexi bacterium]|nr:heme ABC exporter ATP-binding protein CcmA [Chloroflexota bacterium]
MQKGMAALAAAMPESAEWAISIEKLTKQFGSTKVLRGLDLQVAQGEKLTVAGPNGAGKTTLLRILSTVSRPTAGHVSIAGFDIAQDGAEVRRRIGVISHQTYLYHDLTVAENLVFYGRMYDVPDVRKRVEDIVAQVGLAHRLHDPVGTLSRGMQQRVSIARAAIHDPPIMLLDEPDTGLDQHAAGMLRAILQGVGAEGRTVILTTHNLELGLQMCDRVAILAQGRIVHTEPRGSLDVDSFRRLYYEYTGAQL